MTDDERELIYRRIRELEGAGQNLQFQNDGLLNRCRTLDLEIQFAFVCLFGVVLYLFGVEWWHAIILALALALLEYFTIARRERRADAMLAKERVDLGDWS